MSFGFWNLVLSRTNTLLLCEGIYGKMLPQAYFPVEHTPAYITDVSGIFEKMYFLGTDV